MPARVSTNTSLIAAKNASVDVNTFCTYNRLMEFTWSDAKRALNIKTHGIDFVDVHSVFDGLTYMFEDDRFSYSE